MKGAEFVEPYLENKTIYLIKNIDKLHTTQLGDGRIRKNLCLCDVDDVSDWCRGQITDRESKIERTGKNWYITTADRCRITVNAYSYTIITAHKLK